MQKPLSVKQNSAVLSKFFGGPDNIEKHGTAGMDQHNTACDPDLRLTFDPGDL